MSTTELQRCPECGQEFEPTPENTVSVRHWTKLYYEICKACAVRLKKEGKIRILKQGGVKL